MSNKNPPKGFSKGRKPTDKESELWSLVMRDVAPIKKQDDDLKPPVENDQPIKESVQTVRREPKAQKPSREIPVPRQKPESRFQDDQSSQQMDARRHRKLKQGRLPIEATLDLHGLNQAEAHAALNRFISHAKLTDKRCVLVITGKGNRRYSQKSTDDTYSNTPPKGILKRNLPVWLAQEPIKSMVLKTETAKAQHGGSGAYYVYLRRNKE